MSTPTSVQSPPRSSYFSHLYHLAVDSAHFLKGRTVHVLKHLPQGLSSTYQKTKNVLTNSLCFSDRQSASAVIANVAITTAAIFATYTCYGVSREFTDIRLLVDKQTRFLSKAAQQISIAAEDMDMLVWLAAPCALLIAVINIVLPRYLEKSSGPQAY